MARRKSSRASWGYVRKLPSGRFQASYIGPDEERHNAPMTFDARQDADAWLARQRAAILEGRWTVRTSATHREEQAKRGQTFGEYAQNWLRDRTNGRDGKPLRPRTVAEYERLLRGPLRELADQPLAGITPPIVRTWRTAQLATGSMTQTSRAYDLAKSILNVAVTDEIIKTNPCNIRGGSSTKTGKRVEPPTDAELEDILKMITPQYRAMVVLAAFGGLRYGEITELRRRDIINETPSDYIAQVADKNVGLPFKVRVSVSRAVARTPDGFVQGTPKSAAGVRSVALFGLDAECVVDHLNANVGRFPDSLLFPSTDGRYLPQSTFYKHWARARHAAGRDDLPFHALRHYAGTRYAQAGATPKETMARLGHSSMGAAMRYQHSGNRDDELAARIART